MPSSASLRALLALLQGVAARTDRSAMAAAGATRSDAADPGAHGLKRGGGAAGLDAIHRAVGRGRAVDRAVVAVAEDQLVQGTAVACSSLAQTRPGARPTSPRCSTSPRASAAARSSASWIIVVVLLLALGRLKSAASSARSSASTFHQMWGALLVGVFIFGLAYVFNYSGHGVVAGEGLLVARDVRSSSSRRSSASSAWRCPASNTSTNAMFGKFQALVGMQLGFPPLLLPTLNSVGAEIGKPIAPQTASVGVSTSKFVRNGGRGHPPEHGLTFIPLAYLVVISVAC